MTDPQAMTASLTELVDAYSRAARLHNLCTLKGDYRAGNEQASIVASVYRELRARGIDAQRALLPLLANPDPGVKGWAAAHALEFSPDDGEPVLEELSRATDIGIAAFTAQITLKQWKEGALTFP